MRSNGWGCAAGTCSAITLLVVFPDLALWRLLVANVFILLAIRCGAKQLLNEQEQEQQHER